LDREVTNEEIDRAPDDTGDGGSADCLAGANDEQSLVLSGVKDGVVGHRTIFSAVIVPAESGAHFAVKELKLMSAIFVLGFLAHWSN
jgi:hypothetical protein